MLQPRRQRHCSYDDAADDAVDAAAGFTWEAAAALKHFSTTSVTLWLVSTLPPTTAASDEGLSRQWGGILTVRGARQP